MIGIDNKREMTPIEISKDIVAIFVYTAKITSY